ncbi:hypothetical protein [Amycolatopsis sp. MJM2582]|nr:hypothetical protein [Amycolatopsis sp. MJM2582]
MAAWRADVDRVPYPTLVSVDAAVAVITAAGRERRYSARLS